MNKSWITILVSLLLALVLASLPAPIWANWFRPYWVLLILIFWFMSCPAKVSVGCAWVVGLLADLLNNLSLGTNALIFVFIAYLMVRYHKRIRLFSYWQKNLLVFGIILLYQLLQMLVQYFTTQQYLAIDLSLVRAFTSMLVWLWLAIFLDSAIMRIRRVRR